VFCRDEINMQAVQEKIALGLAACAWIGNSFCVLLCPPITASGLKDFLSTYLFFIDINDD
jgi:hypothetical protein